MLDADASTVAGDPELLKAVKDLVAAVRDFLHADDGCDNDRIVAMGEGVRDVLTAARKTPALHEWADRMLADDAKI
jgi:hypothetical protein